MELKMNDDIWRPKPGVINTEIIRQAIRKMIQDEIPGVKFDEEEGYEFHEVTILYLEHLDILRIDFLWIMPALTVLKLTGNLISKIENLETLVYLEDLNLSFNRIQVIENLDKLTKLRNLTLFSNLITKIENLSHLEDLKILSLGDNQIEDKGSILHLRKMNLFSLIMAGNPCVQDGGFREYMAAFVPNLEYYEYKKISQEEKEAGRATYLEELEAMEREEAKETKEQQAIKDQADKEDLFTRAFVEELDGDQLYEAMLEADPSGQAFLLIGEDVVEVYNKFREEIGNATTEIFNIGLEQLKLREKEIETYQKSTQDAVVKSRTKQREILERFLENKSIFLVEIAGMWEDESDMGENARRSLEETVDKANYLCTAIKKELLTLEITLSEQLKEVFSLFERSLGDMVNSFIEAAQGFFTTMRECETVFGEQLGDHSSRFLAQLIIRSDDISSLPAPLRPIMIDKEALNTALASCHDVHLQVIDNREDRLMNRARTWYHKLCQDTEQEEIARFRGRISEIMNFLELQANDFQQYNVNLDDDLYILNEK